MMEKVDLERDRRIDFLRAMLRTSSDSSEVTFGNLGGSLKALHKKYAENV